jgi:two-component system phosphate regulon response regulator PhoB
MPTLSCPQSAPATVSPRTALLTHPWLEKMLAPGSRKGSILLVDDVSDMRTLLRFFLERQGYLVHEAGNGDECLRQARTKRPDVIALNFLMPVMDGLTALRTLKMDPTISYLKVLMYSATGNFKRFQALALEYGAAECLHTPCDLKIFVQAVDRVLRSP